MGSWGLAGLVWSRLFRVSCGLQRLAGSNFKGFLRVVTEVEIGRLA